MTQNNRVLIPGAVVEEELSLTLEDLCRACFVEQSYVIVWVQEGVLELPAQGVFYAAIG